MPNRSIVGGCGSGLSQLGPRKSGADGRLSPCLGVLLHLVELAFDLVQVFSLGEELLLHLSYIFNLVLLKVHVLEGLFPPIERVARGHTACPYGPCVAFAQQWSGGDERLAECWCPDPAHAGSWH